MKSSRSALLVVTLLAAAAIGLALFSPRLFSKKDLPPLSEPRATHATTVSAKGVVESVDEIVIGSQVKGLIRSMPVKEGDPVVKGETLALLDTAKLQAEVAEATAAVRSAAARLKELESGSRSEEIDSASARVSRAETVYRQTEDEYRKQERLYAKDAVTGLDLDRSRERMSVAQADLNAAQADLNRIRRGERAETIEQARAFLTQKRSELAYCEAMLRDYTLLSPLDGVVTEHLRKAGETVDIGTHVVRLINPCNLRIRAEIEETDVGKVTLRHKVEVVTDAFKGKVFQGRVMRIFPAVTRKSQKTFDPLASFDINTQTVHVQLDDYSGLKHGMSVTAKFLP